MSANGKIKFLVGNLDKQISSFGQWSHNNKKKAFLLKMFATSFGAATTVLLGLQGIEGKKILGFDSLIIVKNMALILSALVTLFSAWDAFFDHRTLWVNQTNTTNQLKAIKAELQYLSAEENEDLKEEDINRLFSKYQSVLDSSNQQWIKLRADNSKQSE